MTYPKVLDVKPLENHKIEISYETGEVKLFDVSPYISGEWYGQLNDPNFFSTVHPAGRTVEWADGQDIAPHELYEDSITLKEKSDIA